MSETKSGASNLSGIKTSLEEKLTGFFTHGQRCKLQHFAEASGENPFCGENSHSKVISACGDLYFISH